MPVADPRAELMEVHIRNMDPDVWRALRAEAVRQGISVAQIIERLWFAHSNPEPVRRP